MSTLVCSVSFGRNVTGGGRAGAGGRAGGRSRVGRSRNRSVGPSVCPSGGRPTSWGPRWGCWGLASIEKYLFPIYVEKYVVSIVVCLFCCSLSLIRWALQVMRDAQFSLAKSSRHVLGKNNFGTKVCETGPKSEHGHVHHVPKAPSEGTHLQKNIPLCFCFEDNRISF